MQQPLPGSMDLDAIVPSRSNYYFSLSKESKLRYNSKLSLIGEEDPYLVDPGYSEEVALLPSLK